MSKQTNLFYRKNQAINFNFSAEAISSDGGIFLLEKIERKTELIKEFSSHFNDNRHKSYIKHDIYQLLKQRVFLLIQGYENCNPHCGGDEEYLRNDFNVRYFSSNMDGLEARDLYWEFYVKRGDSSENRIKEIKNMCFSGRLSCHKFTANYLRLFMSTLAYELMLKIREMINLVRKGAESRWQMDNIRLYLLKVGTTIRRRAKSITICYSKSYVCQNLFMDIVRLC